MASEYNFEERILTPATGRMLFGLTLQQHDIELYLNRRMSNGQEDMATRINNWLIVEALTAYGIVRGATFLLAKKCERNVQLQLKDEYGVPLVSLPLNNQRASQPSLTNQNPPPVEPEALVRSQPNLPPPTK